MRKVTLNDWQTMHTRKELEELHKKSSLTNTINFSLVIEFILLFIGFCLDNIYNAPSEYVDCVKKAENSISVDGATHATTVASSINVWGVISIISISILIVFWTIYAIYTSYKWHLRSKVKSTKEIVDLIDNKLCYYLMTADLIDVSDIKMESEIDIFYIIEKSYYINKCVMIFMTIDNNLKNALSCNKTERDYLSGKISCVRITNIIAILENIYNEIDEKLNKGLSPTNEMRLHVDLENICSENEYYQKQLDGFKQAFEANVKCLNKK